MPRNRVVMPRNKVVMPRTRAYAENQDSCSEQIL